MHIGFFTSELSHKNGNYAGGLGNVAVEMINYLSKKPDIDLYVFSLSKNLNGPRVVVEKEHKVIYHWFPMSLFGILTNNNYNTYMQDFSQAVLLYLIENYLTKDPAFFNIAHFHDWMVIPILLNLHSLKYPKIRRILHMHSTEYGREGNKINYHDDTRSRESLYKHNLEMVGCHSADLVIPVSKGFGEELVRLFGIPKDKVRFVNNGMNFDFYISNRTDHHSVRSNLGIADDDPVIVFCGRLVWQKNPRLLLESFMLVHAVNPRVKLLFLGDGDMKGELQDYCKLKKVFGTAVHFLGSTNGKAKLDYYSTANLVAVPSFNEPFGLIIIEAYASGTPVIIPNNIAPTSFLYPEIAYMCNPDVESFSKTILQAIRNKDETKIMGVKGKEYVLSCMKDTDMGNNIYNIYSELSGIKSKNNIIGKIFL